MPNAKSLILTGILVSSSMFFAQNDPIVTYQVGNSKVTVWENEREGEFGKFTSKDFKVEKSYKDGDEWKSTNYFSLAELLELRAAIDKAIHEEGVTVKSFSK